MDQLVVSPVNPVVDKALPLVDQARYVMGDPDERLVPAKVIPVEVSHVLGEGLVMEVKSDPDITLLDTTA